MFLGDIVIKLSAFFIRMSYKLIQLPKKMPVYAGSHSSTGIHYQLRIKIPT